MLNAQNEEANNVPGTKSKPNIAPVVSQKDMGTWQKHTKGFGAKILQKFGWKGAGLGAHEDGVSGVIETAIRPERRGLGDIKEITSSTMNKKLEAEWRGVEYKEEEEQVTDSKGNKKDKKSNKSQIDQIIDSMSWKKGKAGKNKAKVISVSELLKSSEDKNADLEKKQVVIDMRGNVSHSYTHPQYIP